MLSYVTTQETVSKTKQKPKPKLQSHYTTFCDYDLPTSLNKWLTKCLTPVKLTTTILKVKMTLTLNSYMTLNWNNSPCSPVLYDPDLFLHGDAVREVAHGCLDDVGQVAAGGDGLQKSRVNQHLQRHQPFLLDVCPHKEAKSCIAHSTREGQYNRPSPFHTTVHFEGDCVEPCT